MAKKKRINLALQGGGAHGAFTWGVLDRLLLDEDIEIAAISGASAGALNAAALKAGLVEGDRQTARDNLDWLWGQVGAIHDLRLTAWIEALAPSPAIWNMALDALRPGMDFAQSMFTPYVYGPMYRNPLQPIAAKFKYEHICGKAGPELHIATTNVRTGKIRVFKDDEITADVILASSCLPNVFQAIVMEDPKTGVTDAFWDGGYTGNPALFPLFARHLPDDIVVVNINPIERPGIPVSPAEIENRVNEISFNSSLLRELRAIKFVKDLIADHKLPEGQKKDVLVHMIADDDIMRQLSVNTKLTPTPSVLLALKTAGQDAAETFLGDHRKDLNVTGTLVLEDMFG